MTYSHIHGEFGNCSAISAYGVCIPEDSCIYFTRIPRKYQCDFVKNTTDCLDEDALIQYMLTFACDYNNYPGQIYFGLLIVVTEVMLLFLVLGTTADNFFSPSICAISNTLGLSENLAGVTLLAFGNASPDIFTSLAGATMLGTEIVECQLLGGGIFVTSIVASCILLTKNFYANPSAFVRDTVFFMAAIIWMRYISSKHYIHTAETAVLIVMYVVYMSTVAIDALYRRRKHKRIVDKVNELVSKERRSSLRTLSVRSSKTHIDLRKMRGSILTPQPSPTDINDSYLLPPPSTPRRRAASRLNPPTSLAVTAERLNVLNTAGLADQLAEERLGNPLSIGVTLDGDLIYGKKQTLWEDFVNEIIPIDDEDWNSSGNIARILILLKGPIIYVFKLIIPVVDQGAINNGWCKLLNCLHCIVAPMFLAFSLHLFHLNFWISLSLGLGIFALCSGVASVVFFTSSINKAPRYHIVFAIMGFITAMNTIFTVSHELVSLLKVAGYLLDISIATIAMTFLAYGNSVGDVVSNIALAKAGYPRMAWAGCFGSPLLSALLGNGLSLTFLIESTGHNHSLEIHPRYSGLVTNCFFFLILSLGSSLLIIPAMNFQCRRSYATFLIFVYAMFLSFSIMCEFEFIHPLGL